MDEMKRSSRGKGERHIGAATRLHAPRLLRSNFQISNLKSRIPGLISTRQCCRIESSATHSKQGAGAPATRQFSEECPVVIFKSAISNFECSVPQKGVNQNQMFLTATCSKQTVGACNKCQFFAICISVRDNSEDAGLPGPEPTGTHTTRKNPALHSNLGLRQITRRPNCGLARDDHPDRMVILPTGVAVDYDSPAQRTGFAALGSAKLHLTVCGSSPSTGRRHRNDETRNPMSTTRTKSDRLN